MYDKFNEYTKNSEQQLEKLNNTINIKGTTISELERKFIDIEMQYFKEKQILEQKIFDGKSELSM